MVKKTNTMVICIYKKEWRCWKNGYNVSKYKILLKIIIEIYLKDKWLFKITICFVTWQWHDNSSTKTTKGRNKSILRWDPETICKAVQCQLQASYVKFNMYTRPWLVWLSELSAACEPKGCQFDSQSGHMPGL